MRIGVISDTHGLLREEAVAALAGSELILHAGDVGDAAVLERLERVAPVRAVRGNVDRGGWAAGLPASDAIEAGGVWIYLVHGHEPLDLDPVAGGFGVVVRGHSHRPLVERADGVLWLNPGSAGPKRFSLPVSLARLEVRGGAADADLVPLPVR